MSTILFGVFFVGLLVGLPVSISMGLSGMTAVLVDGRFMGMVVPQYLFNGISSFPLMAVPFFILAAELMSASGLAGAVLDGGVRDVTEIRRDSGFQVFARSVCPSTTVGRFKTLASNVPVICGGVNVNPGDLVVADLDGVVVVPKEHVEAVLKMAAEIEVREAEQARLIRASKSLRDGLAKYGRI